MINYVGYQEHTNQFFLQSKTLKFMDIVKFRTAQIMFKARNNVLPGNIQKMFKDREGSYDLRGKLNLKQPYAQTTVKSMCFSVCGVTLWNGLEEETKKSKNIGQFKIRYRKTLIDKYKNEDL